MIVMLPYILGLLTMQEMDASSLCEESSSSSDSSAVCSSRVSNTGLPNWCSSGAYDRYSDNA